MVAKSYQNKTIIGEPFLENKKMYVYIDFNGRQKKVRWYSENEYSRMYSSEKIIVSHFNKEALGFKEGYIHIFKYKELSEDEYNWCLSSNLRYAKWWGWYAVSTDEIPKDLPKTFIPIKLNWDDVHLILDNENEVTKFVANIKKSY